MKRSVDLGVLYSSTGTYAAISRAVLRGTLAGIDEVNADANSPIGFRPVVRDPGGEIDRYAPLCDDILANSGARHIFGCVTSSSRKEVIPTLDRTNAMLWYNLPFEGFETSNRVIYNHACANQHLLPLLSWCFGSFGAKPYLIGSNYIWGWETCRVARMRTEEANGQVLGERYLPLGEENIATLIAEIESLRPDFILNSLVGASSYAFLRAYAELGRRDPHFSCDSCPVVSCNLTEAELPLLGEAAEGLVSVGPHFCPQACPEGRDSSFEIISRQSVHTLASMLAVQGDRPFEKFIAERGAGFGIDPATHHSTLSVNVAQVRRGVFEVLHHWADVPPDPYLTRPKRHPGISRPRLSVVS
ncbi:transporter substrate-binding protein [Rhodobacteraceae bacterium F11138]|nr:transporter substrate-binding protein [Rhodobacteraceae bacterium F11138]